MFAAGIEQYAISLTTLEEVFMRIAEMGSADHSLADHIPELANATAQSVSQPGGINAAIYHGSAPPVVSGANIQGLPQYGVTSGRTVAGGQFFRHFAALYRKRAQYARRDVKAVMCMTIMPCVLIGLGLAMVRYSQRPQDPPMIPLDLSQYKDFAQSGELHHSPRLPRGISLWP